MKKIKYVIPILILFLTIGFAAVNSSLSMSGDTLVTSDIDDFNVYYSKALVNGEVNYDIIVSSTELNFSAVLDKAGTTFTVEYDITNASSAFDASVTMSCSQSTEYLSVVNDFDTSEPIPARATRTGVLTLKKLKTNAGAEQNNTVTCSVNASPVERHDEGEGTVVVPLIPRATLKATSSSDITMFRSIDYKGKIKNITFENSINVPENAIETWDLSEGDKGKIIAYLVSNSDDSVPYDLYIQSNVAIYANQDMSYWFYDFSNLKTINNLKFLITSETTNMNHMFSNIYMESLDITSLDTKNVVNMSSMFGGSDIKQLDISGLDTENVTDMSFMFDSFHTNSLDFSNFNTSKVVNMHCMFCAGSYDGDVLDLSSFDTSSVTNMSAMFSELVFSSSDAGLNLSGFNTSKVTDMSNMFVHLEVSSLDLSSFDTSNVTDMSYMFLFTGDTVADFSLELGNNFDTSNVTTMYAMFFGMGVSDVDFTLDLGEKFDTTNVDDMRTMFYGIGYSSSKMNFSITIRNPNVLYDEMFPETALQTGAKIVVNYTDETEYLIDDMIATKSDGANVVKGYNVDNIIQFSIERVTYSAYEGMSWEDWVESKFNTNEKISYKKYTNDDGGYVCILVDDYSPDVPTTCVSIESENYPSTNYTEYVIPNEKWIL